MAGNNLIAATAEHVTVLRLQWPIYQLRAISNARAASFEIQNAFFPASDQPKI